MAGIVLELQRNLISDQCDILSALRKAKVIASKLSLLEFENWIDQELNGYHNDVPEYRKVRGLMRAHYCNTWIPVQMNEKLESKICEQYMTQPISTILEYANEKESGSLRLYPGAEMQNALNKL